MVSTSVTPEIELALREAAERSGQSLASFVRDVLERELESREARNRAIVGNDTVLHAVAGVQATLEFLIDRTGGGAALETGRAEVETNARLLYDAWARANAEEG